jgi:hypothetical protein
MAFLLGFVMFYIYAGFQLLAGNIGFNDDYFFIALVLSSLAIGTVIIRKVADTSILRSLLISLGAQAITYIVGIALVFIFKVAVLPQQSETVFQPTTLSLSIGQSRTIAGTNEKITLKSISLSEHAAVITEEFICPFACLSVPMPYDAVLALNVPHNLGYEYTLTDLSAHRATIRVTKGGPRGSAINIPAKFPANIQTLVFKAGAPYIILSKESAHADYDSRDIGTSYMKDGMHGYYWAFGPPPNYGAYWQEIPNSDGSSFKIISGPYAADKNKVYFETMYKVATISDDPGSFSIVDLESGITKDSKHVYFADQVIEGADVNSITAISGGSDYGLVKDSNYLYIIMRGYSDTYTLYRLPLRQAGQVIK